jgi:hypothetical protein
MDGHGCFYFIRADPSHPCRSVVSSLRNHGLPQIIRMGTDVVLFSSVPIRRTRADPWSIHYETTDCHRLYGWTRMFLFYPCPSVTSVRIRVLFIKKPPRTLRLCGEMIFLQWTQVCNMKPARPGAFYGARQRSRYPSEPVDPPGVGWMALTVIRLRGLSRFSFATVSTLPLRTASAFAALLPPLMVGPA